METIDHRHCEVALDLCGTTQFEKFAQTMMVALSGGEFVPAGGMHDGGADGFVEPIYESASKPTTFFQASKTEFIETKIRQTIKRLDEYGRTVKQIIFFFSQPISNIDSLEQKIETETEVVIRIRDKGYIVASVNRSPQTVQAYNSFLRPALAGLEQFGGGGRSRRAYPFDSRTLCAFLGHEVERRRGNSSLLDAVSDTLVLWALEGTDPDQGVLMSRDEIRAKIEAAIPTAGRFIRAGLDRRLDRLSSKSNPSGRKINHHTKEKAYSLQYDERQKINEDGIEDEFIKTKVSDAIRERMRAKCEIDPPISLEKLVSCTHSVVEKIFANQGMAISVFAQEGDEGILAELPASEYIEEVVDGSGLKNVYRQKLSALVTESLRHFMYFPSEIERIYLQRLSRTYFLLFVLKNEPSIVEYFNSMPRNLNLYVGSDILIKALSEHYLDDTNKTVTMALEVISQAGARLYISEPALDEIYTHLQAADQEMRNNYAGLPDAMIEKIVSGIDRIMIRTYYYARLNPASGKKSPTTWRSFIEQFCGYDGLISQKSKSGLKDFLCSKYNMKYETRSTMESGLDSRKIDELTNAISEERPGKSRAKPEIERVLARNDAVHVLRVYQRRKEDGEVTVPNVFGHKTWWLTYEQAVRRAFTKTSSVTPQFILRPEFLLNYIAFSPATKAVADSYASVFPTVLGVRLGKRIGNPLLRMILGAARSAYEVDPARANAMIIELGDRLKSDSLHLYQDDPAFRADDDQDVPVDQEGA